MPEPANLREARERTDWKKWEAAMREEASSLKENSVWETCDLPPGRKIVSCKWIFKLKTLPDGASKHKARLVARGFSQVEGVDFTETFAPVIRFQSLRMLLAIANAEDMLVHQMDVKTAFLYGDIDAEIFMDFPEGMEGAEDGKVCRLNKSLYGLKQSPRCWNQKLDDFLTSNGFVPSFYDTATYTKGDGDSKVMIGVFVDDLLIASKLVGSIQEVKQTLSNRFKM